MSTLEVVVLVGMLVIAVLGFLGRRHPNADLSDWTVGGRAFGVATSWLLQAGETFTTFTFLGTAGLVVAGGAATFYSMPYVPLGYLMLYFVAPVVWRRAKARGHLTQADFLEDSYSSRPLGVLAAVAGVVFLLPYLQLQITGLGLIVQLVTGNAASETWSMIVGFVLVVAFVLWSGIRGVATTAYFKDALMLVMLLVVCVGVPIHFTGGFTNVFHEVQQRAPEMLSVHGTEVFGIPWYVSNMAISMIGVMFLTLPHGWPPILAARSSKVLRRNYLWLPLYNSFIVLPLIVGYVAFVVLGKDTNPDAALLHLAGRMFPEWVMGLVAIAGIATAMVPSAALLVGMSTLVSRNIVRTRSGRQQYTVTQVTVVVATFLSLVLALVMPDLLANLLLLTFSGLDQLAPAIALALFLPRRVGASSILSGLVAGLVVVIAYTFWLTAPWAISEGIIGLVVNLAVIAVVEAGRRVVGNRSEPAVVGPEVEGAHVG
ncbi:MAG TPA: sodium:solute symporter family protein [Segeticoccus sp.]|uniref:sodium:solute symporter family protein n=1 Tax=Segeticoccus sp. TaxID=2706531 RepID=UPI002D7E3C13|nr:sodium:solute symporter family protein [Segeticoccus sp.]HET8602071.1 sodium:solute symporter family protein [Segeticoccus sp.]